MVWAADAKTPELRSFPPVPPEGVGEEGGPASLETPSHPSHLPFDSFPAVKHVCSSGGQSVTPNSLHERQEMGAGISGAPAPDAQLQATLAFGITSVGRGAARGPLLGMRSAQAAWGSVLPQPSLLLLIDF